MFIMQTEFLSNKQEVTKWAKYILQWRNHRGVDHIVLFLFIALTQISKILKRNEKTMIEQAIKNESELLAKINIYGADI